MDLGEFWVNICTQSNNKGIIRDVLWEYNKALQSSSNRGGQSKGLDHDMHPCLCGHNTRITNLKTFRGQAVLINSQRGQVRPWQTRACLPYKNGICFLALTCCYKWKRGPKVARSSDFSRETGNLDFYFKPSKISSLAPNFNLFWKPCETGIYQKQYLCACRILLRGYLRPLNGSLQGER